MNDQPEYGFEDAQAGADLIRQAVGQHGLDPDAIGDGLILGSGLGDFEKNYMAGEKAGETSGPVAIPYDEIYEALGRPVSHGKVKGHNQKVVIGPVKGTGEHRLVMALNGREHPYEGVSGRRATFFLRIMQLLGVRTLLGSNAAGSLTPDTVTPPALVLTHSAQDLAIDKDNPLVGPNDNRFGPRFPHLGDHYPAATRKIVKQAAEELGIPVEEGMYVRMLGPNYESAEDIYQLRRMVNGIWEEGAKMEDDTRFKGKPVGVVGMSSTYEARVAQHATQIEEDQPEEDQHLAFTDGRAFISVATNFAGSIGPKGFVAPPTHAEVQETAAMIQEQFGSLIQEVLRRLRGK